MRAVVFPDPPIADVASGRIPDISVVVITRDRPEHLRRCLEGLAAQTHRAAEVIVVDSSEAPDSEAVAARFLNVRYLPFPQGRRGMPAARNAGVRVARGDVVAFLDDDCEPSPGWLAGLVAAYRRPGVAGVGGKVSDPIVTLGRERRFLASGEPWAEPDDGDPRPAEVDFLQGGNMSFRREVLLAGGGFDPRYTGSNYREETDLCFRLRRRGYSLVYVPQAAVTHLRAPGTHGVARAGFNPTREFYQARNQVYFVLKNYGLAVRPLYFYLVKQTLERTVAALSVPSPKRLAWWAAHVAGKAAGVMAGLSWWGRARSAPIRGET